MPVYILKLRALTGPGWSTPAEQRLRLALKRLKRDYGLVAEECRPEAEPDPKVKAPPYVLQKPS